MEIGKKYTFQFDPSYSISGTRKGTEAVVSEISNDGNLVYLTDCFGVRCPFDIKEFDDNTRFTEVLPTLGITVGDKAPQRDKFGG